MGCGSSKQPPPEPPKPLYTPPTDFPTPKLLADCQRELAALDTSRQQEVHKDGYPQPFPPKQNKGDIFNRETLSNVREHALKAPTDLPLKPIAELAQYLNDDGHDDLTRLYGAFSWLVYTSQTLHRYQLEPTPPKDTLLYRLVLAHGGYVKHNDIFSELCRELGLTVKPVQGKVKLIKQNLVISEDGAWLAVLLGASWRLVDVDFAVTTLKSRQITHKATLDRIKHTIGLDIPFCKDVEFYFLSDPEQFIFSHWPEDVAWQLLARPVAYDEFKVMTHITEGFFTMGIIDVHEAKGIVESTNGHSKLKLSLPEDNYIKLGCSLAKIAGPNVKQSIKGEKLNSLVELSNTSETVRDITIGLIDIGRYILKIWAQDLNSNNGRQSGDIIGIWFIDCQQPIFVWDITPKTEMSELGTGADLKLLGIELNTLPISQNMDHLFFRCHKKMYAFRYSLESNYITKTQLKQLMVHYTVPNEGSGVIIKFSIPGRYVLNVFVKEKLQQTQFKCVCSLLFNQTTLHLDDNTFSEEFNTRIGHMMQTTDDTMQDESILRPISHKCPFIQNSNGQQVDIVFESAKVYQLIFHFRVQSTSGVKDVSHYVWHNVKEEESGTAKTKITARIPHVGLYTLSVFTSIMGRKSDTFREVYKYLIHAQDHEVNCMPFPQILSGWSPKHVLASPQDGFLREQEEMEFVLAVDNADSVSVFHNKSSLHQTLTLSDDGLYRGKVKSLNGGNHLIITANLQDTTKEDQLLRYSVLKNDAWLLLQEDYAKSEELSRNRQNDLQQLIQDETVKIEKAKEKQAEVERQFAEQFEQEKADLIEREKKWQKEFEDRFNEDTKKMEVKELNDLDADEEAKVVRREIQLILQAHMSENDLRKRLYKGLSEDILRQRLRRAIMSRDKNDLQRAIDDYYNSQLPTKGSRDLLVAERLLELAILREELVDSTWRKDVPCTVGLLDAIRRKNYQEALDKEITEAEDMIQGMQGASRFKEEILNMDKRMMSELKSYQKPPEGVHHVMRAVFLLLGEDEATTTEWSSCATMCNPYGIQGLNRRIQALDIERLHPEIVARAKQLLIGFHVQQVQRVSSGAALFFMWAMSCIGEYEDSGSESSNSFLDNVQPADVERQKALLGKLPLQFTAPPSSHRKDLGTKPALRGCQDLLISTQVSSRSTTSQGQSYKGLNNSNHQSYRSQGLSNSHDQSQGVTQSYEQSSYRSQGVRSNKEHSYRSQGVANSQPANHKPYKSKYTYHHSDLEEEF